MTEFDEQTIDNVESDQAQQPEETAAGLTNPAEDTVSLDSYKRVIESQNETIRGLTDRVVSLQDQIAKLITGGAQINDGKSEPLPDPEPRKDYTYLKDMDWTIDKHTS